MGTDELEGESSARIQRRTLFRAAVGLNAALFLAYVVRVVWAVQTGDDPWAGMAGLWLIPLAVVVFGVMVPLAAIGIGAPLALFDLGAAAWYLMLERNPGGLVFAALFALAFGIGATLQGIVAADWFKRRSWAGVDRRMWTRRIATAVGAIAAVVGAAIVGFAALAFWAFSDKVHPQYLEALRTDPMAAYEQAGLELDSEIEDEAADTWKGFQAAEIQRRFAVSAPADPEIAFERAIAAAEAAGWRPSSDAGDRYQRFTKERSHLSIGLYEVAGLTYLSMQLRSP